MIRTAAILAIAIILSGCSGVRAQWLTEHRYDSLPRDREIEAWFGEIDAPHEPIAILDSRAIEGADDNDRNRQLDQLKRVARRIGADALQNVRILSMRGRGAVGDPATPFPSVKQGPFEKTFLRAEAIRYINPHVDLSAPGSPRPAPAEF